MAVAEPTPADRRWQGLADELAPAKSLQRLDTAAGRVVSAVSMVATVLTGLGLLAAGLTNLSGLPRVLAVVAVVLAFIALLVALAAQRVTITQRLNLNERVEVEGWFGTQFPRRVRLVRWSAWLLVAAVGCAGSAAILSLLLGPRTAPTLAVTRTTDAVTADVTFRDVDPGQVATATVTADGQVAALAAFGPGPDGTATRNLTATRIPPSATVTINAQASGSTCVATLRPVDEPTFACSGA